MTKSGFVVPPEIVESIFLAVRTEPERHEVTFTFRTAAADREFTLRIRGVEDLLITEFVEQNIVHSLRVLSGEGDPQAIRDLLAYLFFEENDAAAVVEPTFVSKIVQCTDDILQGRKLLLEIIPVYGAIVLLVARDVEWA